MMKRPGLALLGSGLSRCACGASFAVAAAGTAAASVTSKAHMRCFTLPVLHRTPLRSSNRRRRGLQTALTTPHRMRQPTRVLDSRRDSHVSVACGLSGSRMRFRVECVLLCWTLRRSSHARPPEREDRKSPDRLERCPRGNCVHRPTRRRPAGSGVRRDALPSAWLRLLRQAVRPFVPRARDAERAARSLLQDRLLDQPPHAQAWRLLHDLTALRGKPRCPDRNGNRDRRADPSPTRLCRLRRKPPRGRHHSRLHRRCRTDQPGLVWDTADWRPRVRLRSPWWSQRCRDLRLPLADGYQGDQRPCRLGALMSESGAPFRGDHPETESWAARVFAANAASEPASGALDGSVWSRDVSTGVAADTHGAVAREVGTGQLPVALLAGAGAALIGGLVWAVVVITTQYDIGFLAWFVGAATGVAIVRVAGGPVSPALRASAGVFAAGGIVVGKYVIFVHALNKALRAVFAGRAHSVGYLNTHAMSVFVHNFGSIVRPVYALWVALAFLAAVRTAGGGTIYTRRRR